MSDWHYIDDHKPQKAGKYLVVARVYGRNSKINYVFLNDWDSKQQAFTYDIARAERGIGTDGERIYAWLPYKQPPHPQPHIIK